MERLKGKEKVHNLNLSPRTAKLIEDTFGTQKCQKCGGPAQRIQNNEFYCHVCARPTCGESPEYVKEPIAKDWTQEKRWSRT
jgi:predicted amidophosphoribosyltransferase